MQAWIEIHQEELMRDWHLASGQEMFRIVAFEIGSSEIIKFSPCQRTMTFTLDLKFNFPR